MNVSKVVHTIIARAFFWVFVIPLPVLAGWDVPFDGSVSQAVGYDDLIIIGSARVLSMPSTEKPARKSGVIRLVKV